MNNDTVWTTVYVYKGLCRHQENMIFSVFGRNDVRLVALFPSLLETLIDEFSRSNGLRVVGMDIPPLLWIRPSSLSRS